MKTQTTTFREISVSATKSGKCIVCSKRRKRTKKFWQTLNPFNKNPDGTIKTVGDIIRESHEKARLWKEEPINCCEETV